MVDTIYNVVDSGRLENNHYVNPQLGIIFKTDEVHDHRWEAPGFDAQYYYDAYAVYWIKEIEAKLVQLQNRNNRAIYDVRIEYLDNNEIKDIDEESRLYSAVKRARIIRFKASDYRKYCKVTELPPVSINGNDFYSFTLTDEWWKTSICSYCIRHGAFGVSVSFYDWDTEDDIKPDPDFMEEILRGLNFTEPEIEYVYLYNTKEEIADDQFNDDIIMLMDQMS